MSLLGAIAAPFLVVMAASNGRWLIAAVFVAAAVINTLTFLRSRAARP